MENRETFLQIQVRPSSAPYSGGSNPWISNVSERTSPHVMSERQNPDTTLDAGQDRQPGIQSFILREDTNNADFGSSL